MLAKVWKKLLLAIAIIAVLFNITAKLVNRISLEKAIKSTPEGVNLKEVLNITEENTVAQPVKKSSSEPEYKTVEEAQAEMKAKQNEEEKAVTQTEEIEQQKNQSESEEIVENSAEETRTTGGQIVDFVTDAVTNAKQQTEALY